MKWQYLLIPVGVVLTIIGFVMAAPFLDQTQYPKHATGIVEETNILLPTDYPIWIGVASLGTTMIIVVIVWKYKSSKKNP